ncbi:FCD domain-containing protein [Sinomonas sp. ASV322]|uniref:FadR/GntR family transcriptional regulator n=1 Tax=Sinomonas sp. ASV322 TaxID=3041920 RepID=UPI0027DCEF0E|nr:FCD domain-containing protein [Sinomonas sp. ASV322]MDQ4502881.1 FCD domain-containing protein [Sinomonas sp. ASV322]
MATASPEEPATTGDGAGLHRRMLDAVGEDIASGRLAPGTRLTLEELQHGFGVSRTVARDTIRVLETMNLVTSKRRVGIVVHDPSLWNVYDPQLVRWRLASARRDEQYASLTELRIGVEPVAAACAARRASGAQRAELAGLAAQLRALGQSGDLEAFLAVDIAFHRLILRSSGNEMFAALDGMIAVALTSRTRQGLMPFHPRGEALDAHERAAAAVVRGDAQGAEDALREVLQEVRAALNLA